MITFVATGVLRDYETGMIVLKAPNREKAIEMIKHEFPSHGFILDCGDKEDCDSEYCLKYRLRELKDNELLYVWGSD